MWCVINTKIISAKLKNGKNLSFKITVDVNGQLFIVFDFEVLDLFDLFMLIGFHWLYTKSILSVVQHLPERIFLKSVYHVMF